MRTFLHFKLSTQKCFAGVPRDGFAEEVKQKWTSEGTITSVKKVKGYSYYA